MRRSEDPELISLDSWDFQSIWQLGCTTCCCLSLNPEGTKSKFRNYGGGSAVLEVH